MTAKRFYLLNYNNYPIYDSLNDKEYNAQFKVQREKLCLLLNELNDENQALKQSDNITDLETQIMKLKEENEQLKSDNNRLVNETAKVVAEHQKRVLDMIDEKIKELQNINNVPIIPRESIEVLEQLKKELQE